MIELLPAQVEGLRQLKREAAVAGRIPKIHQSSDKVTS